jgi:hypothetical protein
MIVNIVLKWSFNGIIFKPKKFYIFYVTFLNATK